MPYKDKNKQRERNKEYQKLHYQKKKQYYKDKAEERQQKLKYEFLEFKKGLKCSNCAENHTATLDFHHIDPSKKENTISQAIIRGWGKERLNKELEKCIVLCSNCHRKLHYNETLRSGLEGPAVVS